VIHTRAQKEEIVAALAAKLGGAPTIYVTDFTGLNVARLTELRRRLRAAGVEYLVVKNTLALRALGEDQLAGLKPHLDGPTALALGGPDPILAAKVLAEFAREHEKPAIRGGLVDGRAVTPDQVRYLAALPPRPELLAQVGGALQAPLAGFVGALNGLLYMMVGALEALHAQRTQGAAS
jgi:large subunit ribosomal protein L10